MAETTNPLDLLLQSDLPDLRKALPTKEVGVLRLTKAAGAPVIFRLRAMTSQEVRRINETRPEDRAAQAVLLCCQSPSWKDSRLLDPDRDIATPLDAIHARLLPGETDELFVEIQRLTGYLSSNLAEVKNG